MMDKELLSIATFICVWLAVGLLVESMGDIPTFAGMTIGAVAYVVGDIMADLVRKI